jgi:hypothetical protein
VTFCEQLQCLIFELPDEKAEKWRSMVRQARWLLPPAFIARTRPRRKHARGHQGRMARARRRCKAGGRLIMGGLSCVWARYRFSLGGVLHA